jgi:prefoldin subunit 5
MQQMLEQFRKQSQEVLDKATANGADPAKLEATRQTYDAYMQEIQAQIDALDQAPVPTPP